MSAINSNLSEQWIEDLRVDSELEQQKNYSKELRRVSEDILRWAECFITRNGGQFIRASDLQPSIEPNDTAQWEAYIKLLQECASDITSVFENQKENSVKKCLVDLTCENQKLYNLLKSGCYSDPNDSNETETIFCIVTADETMKRSRFIPTLEDVVDPKSEYNARPSRSWISV